jgi:plasmid stabilization system protein ParE
MKTVRFLASARRELLAEVLHYNGVEVGLGAKFVSAFEQALAVAVQFPLAGSSGPAGTRKVILKDFPFSVFYLAQGGEIVVVAIAHHARRPGYWSGRLNQDRTAAK